MEEFTREEPAKETEDYSELYEALSHLPETARISVTLYYIEGYSVKEIAKIMDVTESAVKSRLARARSALKDELEGNVRREGRFAAQSRAAGMV